MGHRKYSAPRRGSLAYLPRGRSSHWAPRIRFWPEYEGAPKLLAFAGFKAGTSHVTIVDNRQGSLNYGKEVTLPVTVVETPPLLVTAASQPRLAKIGKKKPDLMEVKIDGGTVKDQLEFAKKLLGKEVKVADVFKEGMDVDVIGITKGKGIQGPVKRWGIKKLKHKSRKTVRGVGSIGPWHPHYVMYSVPRAGQMGFAQRTEYNKQILKIGDNGADVTPKGGFLHYGPIKTEFTLLRGTIPGPPNRLVALRTPARGRVSGEPPKMEMISLASRQGA